MPRYNEFKACLAFAQWWGFYSRIQKIPESLLMHIPNASATSIKYRANNKLMGVRAGTPDYFLAIPKNNFHGMWLEMKTAEGRLSPEQKEMLAILKQQGFHTVTCWSCDEARLAIETYLKPTT